MSDQTPKPGQPLPAAAWRQAQVAQQQATVTAALRGAAPRFYANVVNIAQSASDVSLILMSNFVAVGVVSMSYITAKTLRKELDRAIGQFEKAVNQEVPTIEEIDKKLQKVMEGTDAKHIT